MNNVFRPIDLPRGDAARTEALTRREWLITNGLGGYASGTLGGVPTRRYHGLLIAALPNPLGRTVMLAELSEQLRLPDGTKVQLGGEPGSGSQRDLPDVARLQAFSLELGLPVWRYEIGGVTVEKRVVMPHEQNTVHVTYRLIDGADAVRIKLRPAMNFRPQEQPVSTPLGESYVVRAWDERLEVTVDRRLPPLRLAVRGERRAFTMEPRRLTERLYPVEQRRGYDAAGDVWTPGHFRVDLSAGSDVAFIASTEPWDVVEALHPADAVVAERERREQLLLRVPDAATDDTVAELVLAADSFIVSPAYRAADVARRRAAGDEMRTIIAGYHWFTDWGRDTMISLEGLTLCTGRQREAGSILRTFAQYARDGLIPNMFPEGSGEGLYHTADASLWFFHAVDRYVDATGDRATLQVLLPVLRSIVDHHLRGTRYGIRIDPADGLMTQGEEGYQLTWMDAKVDDWVVTPRRGKAVELNALWYNALRLLELWLDDAGDSDAAGDVRAHADRAYASFNDRFWYADGRHLFDIVDGEDGDDTACRPNQLFAVSLPHPVLAEERWPAVVGVVRDQLVTPVGLRSLSRDHPAYRATYRGNLRERDGAYHQGTVWGWLIGPFVDAWLKVYPDDRAGARGFLDGLVQHLDEFGVGSIAEIFDAEPPFTPRGCIAQAWSVAEVLRCWRLTAKPEVSGA